ncbi:restriction endonuclease subunit S [Vibrio parahaemolyticus]|nr:MULTISPECIES: restriction endonuclease subunit S [Vibrio]EGQ8925741.1 restriction endonuclease subunit S [Vibrio parahaemolyticus]EGR0097834.1 restriction endonuclease subunit S [Vibrio vulnificus]EGR2180701.1 restriction endonuclease subunit S [Vibrio parahaemolyticus]EGR2857584.1 restriction endonuclease subunit S [Vibrio parahaemolyticus]EGR2945368.1 restriction endonuclease subunit S [Vibrio parahaemolyticus]
MAFSKDINELVSEDSSGLLNKHESWERVTLQDVVEVINGYAFSSSGFNTGKGLPLIRIRDIVSGKTDTTYEGAYSEEYIVQNGDLLVGMDGDFNSSFWRSGVALLNQRVCKLIANETFYSKKFLAYLLPGYLDAINQNTSAVTVKHLSSKTIQSIPLPLPPRKEQDRLVEKLEELFSEFDIGIEELKAAQTKLSQYRQSLLKSAVEGSLTQQWRVENSDRIQETGEQLLARILKQRREQWLQQKLAEFAEKGKTPPKNWQDKYPEPVQPDTTDLPELPEGWGWASLDMIISKVEAGKSFKCLERPPELGEYGVVKVSAVTWGEYNEQESKTCTRSDLENDTILIKEEDFLFSRANTTELVGACVIAKHVTKKVMLSDKILRLQFVENKLKYWLLQFMRGELGRTQIEYAASGNQASMKNVAQGKLLKFAVPLPPLAEVEEIQSNLTSAFQYIVNSASEAEITLKFLHAQRKNILKSAFSGQLVPQEPNDEPASVLLEKIKREREALAKMPKPRKPSKPKKKVDLMNTLLEVLTAENDWIDAQGAFQKCGIVDGTSTDRIEEIYTELRRLEKAGKIQIQRQGDFDRLKLIKQDVKED